MLHLSKHAVLCVAIMLIALGLAPWYYGHAAVVEHELENKGNNLYTAKFSLRNDGSENIEAFTLYFENDLHNDISILFSPPSWDAFAVDPDIIFGTPEPGFADFYTSSNPLPPGSTLENIQLSFLWIGNDELSNFAPYFEIYDPNNFTVISSGTSSLQSVTVAAPPTLAMLLASVVFLLIRRTKSGEMK